MANKVYFCGPHDNWKWLKPGGRTYVSKDDKTHALDRPEVDGVLFGYTVDSQGPAPEAPRGVRFIVMVNDVLLDVPVQIVDDGRHLGFGKDGSPKWLGPQPANIEDAPARQLLSDVIGLNRLKRKELEPLLARLAGSGPTAAGSVAPAGPAPGAITLIEKAANDAGFDLILPRAGAWLAFASTHAPLTIWVTSAAQGELVTAFSSVAVASALIEEGAMGVGEPAPLTGAVAVLESNDVATLYQLLRRAFYLSRSLPDTPLREYEAALAKPPSKTEVERLVAQRVGQDIFRRSLIDYWGGRCAVTGLAVPELLRASHIKPWADCANDDERLDVFNGLLLAPSLDALFDGGWLTVLEDGSVQASARLTPEARTLLGVAGPLRVDRLTAKHQAYLAWHRAKVFET